MCVCVCVPVLSAKLVAIHFKRHTILYTYNPATNPNKPTEYCHTLHLQKCKMVAVLENNTSVTVTIYVRG